MTIDNYHCTKTNSILNTNGWLRSIRVTMLIRLFSGLIVMFSTQFAVHGAQPPDPFDIPNPLDDPACVIDLGVDGNCVSKDLEVVGAFLDTGDVCNACDEGDQVTATLFLSIINKTGSTRTSFAIFGDLETIDPDGIVTTCPVSRCSGPIPPMSTTIVEYGEITFTCGDQLSLKDVLLSWTDASPNSNCANHDCMEIAPKCGTVAEIAIAPPLQSSAVAICDGPVVDVDLTVQSGTPPFSYSWTGPGGFTANTEDLNDVAPGTYDVMVTDALGCTTSASATQDVCCEFSATCPTNTDLGDFDCTQLGNIPACPTTAAEAEAPPYNIVIGDDPCGTIVVLCSDDITDYNVCATGGQTVTRTITIFDDLDGDQIDDANEDSQACSFTFDIVEDTTAPVPPTAPADLSLQCSDEVPAPGELTATDNCSPDITVTGVDTDNGGSGCPGDALVITRTWTFEDACGNSSSIDQTITVIDDTAPVLSGVPGEATVQCDAIPAAANPTATDNCDPNPVVSLNETSAPGSCANEQIITRTWTATDACGNSSMESQTITVIDDTAPVLSGVPGEATVQCDAIPAAANPTATDNCDPNPVVSLNETSAPGSCANEQIITRTWTATDACGNSSMESQIITVIDDTAPVLSGVPGEATVQCDAIPAAANPTATDNCDPNPVVSLNETSAPGSCANEQIITRTWTATDACGNSSMESQIITVIDDTAPVLSGVPGEATVQCDAIPAAANPTATDNCDPNPVVSLNETSAPGSCANEQIITRTWTATDACGNSSMESQIITVIDDTAPVLSGVPGEATVQCDAIPAAANPTATDNCDPNPVVSLNETSAPGSCANEQIITRTWTATDACGNSSMESQIITVIDDTAPVLSGVPGEATVQCDAIPAAANPTATDNCDPNPVVSLNETSAPGSCANEQIITRTWTATDACGNSSMESQIITVIDDTAPVLSGVPGEATVQCDAIPAAANPTATDNCDPNPVVSLNETSAPGSCANEQIITRTWTATDACGNSSMESQIITVIDDTAPVLSGVPGEATVQCDAIPAAANPTATDNCDPNPVVSLNETSAPGSCANEQIITRTWTATDACGNSSMESQIITVIDDTAPVLSGVPGEATVQCDAIPAAANPTATDNCDPDPEVTFAETTAPGACPQEQTITRTWTATDACGNSSSESQVLTVIDDTKPVLAGVPADDTVQCDAIPAAANPTATDNCDPNPVVSLNETSAPGSCANEQTITRTWTATDACGNSSSESQVLTVIDDTKPVITCPADAKISCGRDGNEPDDSPDVTGMATATDNCDAAPVITYTDTERTTLCGAITRTWRATDACGNFSECTQEISTCIDLSIVKTFVPDSVPQGTMQSFTIEVSNAGPSDAVEVSVTDTVDDSLEVTGVAVTSGTGDCSDSAGQEVDCTVDIPEGESVIITIDYTAAPFLTDEVSINGTQSGDDFRFVFVNGSVLEGSTEGGPVFLDGVDITDDVTIIIGLTKNDLVFDPPGPNPAFTMHLSCSDPFTGGWGQGGGPVEGVDTNWQIAFFAIARYQNGDFRKACGNVTNPFDVPNTATATGTDSFGTQTVPDDATVTIEPGITLTRLQTNGKRLTVRLTNFTEGFKEIDDISIMWPASNDNLKKIRLNEPVVWSGSEAPLSVLLDATDPGWIGGTLQMGEGILRFDFAKKSANSGYVIRLNFTDGTFLDITK